MIRIVATADNHLGRYYARMSTAALEVRRRHLRHGFLEACRYALNNRADVFLIAGDLFDQTAPRNVDRTIVADYLAQLSHAGIQVFAVAGNHDSPRSRTEEGGYAAVEVYHAARLLHLFPELGSDLPEAQPQVLRVRDHTLAVAGWSPSFGLKEGDDPFDHSKVVLPAANLRIMLVHCLIEGWVHPDATEPVARRASLEGLRDVDLVVAGDIHSRQQARLGGVQVVVPGASEWMDFGEADGPVPGFVDITYEDTGRLRIQHVPVTPQPRLCLELGAPDLGTGDPTTSVTEAVRQALGGLEQDALVLVRITGTASREVYEAFNPVEVAERLRDRLCHLEINLSNFRPLRAQGQAGPRGPRRSLADEIRMAATEISASLTENDKLALPNVVDDILTVIGGKVEPT